MPHAFPYLCVLHARRWLFGGLLLWSVGSWAQPVLTVHLDGVPAAIEQPVRDALALVQEQGHPYLTPYRIRTLYGRAPDQIRAALRPFGYYRPVVEGHLERHGEVYDARFTVQVGPPVRVAHLDLRLRGAGGEYPALRQWVRDFPLPQGAVLRDPVYEQAKAQLLQLAMDNGYLEARFLTHRIAVHRATDSADIELVLDTGPRYSFGELSFSRCPLAPEFLQRFATFSPGDPFDAERIYQLQKRLSDSDYFASVEVVPHPEQAREGRIPVSVVLYMRPRSRYSVGAGYGTDTGARGTLGLERRWVNERGHRAAAKTSVSQIGAQLDLSYRIPMKDPSTDYLGLLGRWDRERTDTSVRETANVGLSYTTLAGQWLRTDSVDFQRESFNVAGEAERTEMWVPGVSWRRTVADRPIHPRHGWQAVIGFKGASMRLGSATSLGQLRLRGKWVQTLAWGDRVLARGDLGLSAVSRFDRLPVSLRFFAGGDTSVRGYAYNSLGPRNSAGEVVGGRHLLVGSVEYEHRFSERWAVALFSDAGNAFDTRQFDLMSSAGVGLRWRLPFGTVRVDVATALSLPGQPWRVHINVGPDL